MSSGEENNLGTEKENTTCRKQEENKRDRRNS